MDYGERLRTARRARNWTQAELAEKSGVPQGTISKIERGDQETSRYDVLLADALEISATWLARGTGQMTPHANVSEQTATYTASQKSVPVISQVQAGQWAEAVDLFEPGAAEEWRPAPATTGEHAIWLRVVGDSMTNPHGQPSVPEGALILVEPTLAPDNGKFVVARMEETGEVTFKKLVLDAGRKFLKPLNPTYPMLEINGNCRIVGVVRKMEMDL